MKKIGIVTFSSAHNYGAVLQAYATQTFLEKQGNKAQIVNYRPKAIDNVYNIYRVKNGKGIKGKIKRFKRKIGLRFQTPFRIDKYNNFEGFIKNTLNTTKAYKKLSDLQKADLKYDCLIAGSDQIWNTDLTKGFDPTYFLEFGNKDATRISYAASLGRDSLDEKFLPVYKRYINNFDVISVREENMKEIIGDITERDITTVMDPTFLLEKEDYDAIKEPCGYEGKDYIYVHIIGKDDNLTGLAEAMSKRLGVPIIHNRLKGTCKNELKVPYTGTPQSWLSLIENAKYIVSNSFHATVFAMFYNKPFVTVPHNERPGRMVELLKIAGLSDHLIKNASELPDLSELTIDYKKVFENLSEKREFSRKFLLDAIDFVPQKQKDNYFNTGNKFNCYGCQVCKEICPVGAISMTEDSEGFKYPQIDKEKCINCGKCERECIYHNPLPKKPEISVNKVYALANKDKEVVNNSASGGVFTALYKSVLKDGGYVVGVKYNDDMVAVYDIADNEKDCEKFRGSKYVAADITDIKPKIKELLESGKKVLFTGNPCQIAGLNKYLGKEYQNLLTAEIICHGTPSPKVFKNYVADLQNRYGKKVVDFKFRDKALGWDTSTVKVSFEDGSSVSEVAKYNDYNRAFLNKVISRPSCYNCQFTGNTDNADITIGDYWGAEKYVPKFYEQHKMGVSLIKLNSEKGIALFAEIKGDFDYVAANFDNIYIKNHIYSIDYTAKRVDLMKNLDTVSVPELLRKNNQYKNTGSQKAKAFSDKSI